MDCVVDETTLGIVVDVPGTLTGVRMIGRGVGPKRFILSDPTAYVQKARPSAIVAIGVDHLRLGQRGLQQQ
jgi:hypothetical protein